MPACPNLSLISPMPRLFFWSLTSALAGFLFIHVAAWQPINGIVFALDGILIGAGDLRFLAIAMVTATAVLVPSAFGVLWLDLGIGWLWGALGAWMVVRAATLTWRYQSGAWAITGATLR